MSSKSLEVNDMEIINYQDSFYPTMQRVVVILHAGKWPRSSGSVGSRRDVLRATKRLGAERMESSASGHMR